MVGTLKLIEGRFPNPLETNEPIKGVFIDLPKEGRGFRFFCDYQPSICTSAVQLAYDTDEPFKMIFVTRNSTYELTYSEE